MRRWWWWWGPLCSRPTRWVGFLFKSNHLTTSISYYQTWVVDGAVQINNLPGLKLYRPVRFLRRSNWGEFELI